MDARVPSNIPDAWWEDGAGFFGESYMLGDDSVEGYIPDRAEQLGERTLREVNGVEQILELAPSASIVDVPCGYGRHSIELANRWYEVVGVDINDQHLEAARARADALPLREHPRHPELGKQRIPVRFIKQDMRTLCRGLDRPSDALINMFYSFGFFADDADNVRALQQFHDALKEGGGRFLMHSDVSPEMFEAKHYRTSEARTLRHGGKLFIEEHFEPKTRRMLGSWTIRRDDKETKLTPYSVRLYSVDELRSMALHVGFKKVSFFGSFAGDPFVPTSTELVMLAER